MSVESNETDNRAEDGGLPELPFVTTSDVLNQLNKNLTELAHNDPDVSLAGLSPRFELQKRLPDGSTVPASQSDLAYSDLKTKLEQSAKFVSGLESDAERAKWAEAQRQVGNSYFHKAEYPAAMDIYLTCLVVKQETPEFLKQTLLPVLNNLAQCTLQLGMHKKTLEFCQIALDELAKYSSSQGELFSKEDSIAKCKIYFKQAKAHRLTGSYGLAREQLNRACACLPTHDDAGSLKNGDDDVLLFWGPYREAIQKEFRLVEIAEKEARKNRQRQKRAMQIALQRNELSSGTTLSSSNNTNNPLAEKQEEPKAPRKYTTLRSRKTNRSEGRIIEESNKNAELDDLSYFQYYCLVVAQVAEALLIWMGDEETKKQVKERIA